MNTIPERDWKYLRSINDELMQRFCEKANQKSNSILQNPNLDSYERYKQLFNHVEDSDERLARCFDDWRRSTIFTRLLMIIKESLLSDIEFHNLSSETQKWIISSRKLMDGDK